MTLGKKTRKRKWKKEWKADTERTCNVAAPTNDFV